MHFKRPTENFNAGIFAPLPPQPPGGVGSIVAFLYSSLGEGKSDIKFISPLPKKNGLIFSCIRSITNAVKLMNLSASIKKGGRVLIFAGAYASFYEKIFWSLLIICLGRRPVILIVDGNFPKFWSNVSPVSKWFFCNYILHSGLILACQTEGWKTFYQTIFPKAKVLVVSATCAKEFFTSPLVQIASAGRAIKFLYVGWVIREKGVIDLLDAMAILLNKITNFQLTIIGPMFDEIQKWESEVNVRGLRSKVFFLGSVTNKLELIKALDDSDIFVLPSHFEGFPVVLLEAMARGKPCIGTNIGGIPDMLNHGQSGVIVEASHPNDLAEALFGLQAKPQAMETLSSNAYARAREKYSYDGCIKSYCEILNIKYVSEVENQI